MAANMDKAINVCVTRLTDQKCCLRELLQWVNEWALTDIHSLEEMHDGVAYCKIMEVMFPDSIDLQHARLAPKTEPDYIRNFKLLQAALEKKGIIKEMPIVQLIKGCKNESLEFLQWFKKFFDKNTSVERETRDKAVANASKTPPKSKKIAWKTNNGAEERSDELEVHAGKHIPKSQQTPKDKHMKSQAKAVKYVSKAQMKAREEKLQKKFDEWKKFHDELYECLVHIELICQKDSQYSEHSEMAEQILKILYEEFDLNEFEDE